MEIEVGGRHVGFPAFEAGEDGGCLGVFSYVAVVPSLYISS